MFSDELGLITCVQATFNIDPSASTIRITSKVTDELNNLETEGIIKIVTRIDSAAPIVHVVKTNG